MIYQLNSNFVFGPVPSRRLGKSLGINNVPAKRCTYSCVYCQLGYSKTVKPIRMEFYKPESIILSVKKRLDENTDLLNNIDYITIVPDGEPTLDKNLGKLIHLLKQFNKPIAILTNASLLWKEDVKTDLMDANLVSVKIDSVQEKSWRFINQANEYLDLNKVLTGIIEFSNDFKGDIISETMLIDTIDYDFVKIANFLKNIQNLKKCYIAIPTRPPSFHWVKPAKETIINKAYQIIHDTLGDNMIELLLGYEGDNFYLSKDIINDILSITAVHPIKESILRSIIERTDNNWNIVEELLDTNQLKKVSYNKDNFYLRKIKKIEI